MATEVQIKFSIIIPCYNTEKTLPKILNCLKNQTYRNFEAIFINDGSLDNSKKIIEDACKTDYRFHIYNKENGGASSARNIGITLAQGDYICFCDSDDEILPTWLEMFDKMPPADMLSQGYIKDGKVYATESKLYHKIDFDKWLEISYKAYTWGFLWCKAFKKNIIKNNSIFFNEELNFQEDLVFILNFLNKCNVISNTDNCYYIYKTENNLNCIPKYKYHRKMLSSTLSIKFLNGLNIKDNSILIQYFQRLMIEDIFIGFYLNDPKEQIHKNILLLNRIFPNGLSPQNCRGVIKKVFYYLNKYFNFNFLHIIIKILCRISKQK